jgi:hypothetical protein
MKYHIGYYGGTCGDFLRGLIVSGLKDIQTKFEDNNLYAKFHEWKPVIEVGDTGKIEAVGPMDIDDDRYRAIKLGHEIGKRVNRLKFYYLECNKDIDKFQKYIYDYAGTTVSSDNGLRSKTSVSVGHEHVNFIHTFNSLKEFYVHMKDYRKNDIVLYITINSIEEANQRWVNNSIKNLEDQNTGPIERLPEKDLQQTHFLEHKEITDMVKLEKKTEDILLPMKYIYNKEYLRRFLSTKFEWDDRCYDALYDAWYSKQDVII